MKQKIINIIGGDQFHHHCKYLIEKKHQPDLAYWPQDGGSFSVYTGYSWFKFTEDNTLPEDDDKINIKYDLTKDLMSQDDQFLKNIIFLLENI